MLARFFFETRVGEWLLAIMERTTGLALVEAQSLGAEPSGRPTAESDA